jgi:hypothetical protein
MGLILDSSVVIAAERRGDTVAAMLKQMTRTGGTDGTDPIFGHQRFTEEWGTSRLSPVYLSPVYLVPG